MTGKQKAAEPEPVPAEPVPPPGQNPVTSNGPWKLKYIEQRFGALKDDGTDDGIWLAVERVWDIRRGLVELAELVSSIRAASDERDWKVLGYGSWSEYIAGEYGVSAFPKLTAEDRDDITKDLAGNGMPTRAIAAVLGVGKSTVARAIAPPPKKMPVPFGTVPTKPVGNAEPEDQADEDQAEEGDWRCPGCGEVLTDDDLEPLYECQDCGTTFGRSDSADGDSHKCPDCNKFAARYGETHDGCGCGEQVEEVTAPEDQADEPGPPKATGLSVNYGPPVKVHAPPPKKADAEDDTDEDQADELAELRAEHDELAAELAEVTAERDQLRAELKTARAELAALKAEPLAVQLSMCEQALAKARGK